MSRLPLPWQAYFFSRTLTVIAAVAVKRTAGAGLQLRVPVVGTKFGSKIQHGRSDTQRIEIVLAPPPDDEFEVRSGEVQELLFEAIQTVQATLAAAGDDPFQLQTSTVSLDFVITDSGSVELLATGSIDDQVSHTVKLPLAPAGRTAPAPGQASTAERGGQRRTAAPTGPPPPDSWPPTTA